MTTKPANAGNATAADRELVLTRLIDAPRESLYRCWTEPALLKQWFAPKPYETPVVEVDVRPGGSSRLAHPDRAHIRPVSLSSLMSRFTKGSGASGGLSIIPQG